MNRKVLIAGSIVALPLVGLLVMSLGRDPHKVDSPLIGKPAPDFKLRPLGGGPTVTLQSLRGRPIVVNFWATWCVPCFQEHPVLQQGARMMQREASFLGVIYEDEEAKVASFLRQRGSAYPTLMDDGGDAAVAYGVYGVPETFFISPDGIIVDKYVGPLDAGSLQALVAKAAAFSGGTR